MSDIVNSGPLSNIFIPQGTQSRLPERAMEFVTNIKQLLRQGSFDAAIALLDCAREESRNWPNPAAQCIEIERAWYFYFTGQLVAAVELSAGLVEDLRNSPHNRELGLSQIVQGASLLALGRLPEAVKSFSVALHVFDWQLLDKRSAIRVLNLLSIAYKRMGKYVLAEEIIQRSLETAHELDNSVLVASAKINLAVVQFKLGRVASARGLLNELLSRKVESTEPQRMRASLVMAQIESTALEFASAQEWLTAALQVIRQNPTSRESVLYREYLADASFGMGDGERALHLLDRALNRARLRFPDSDLICEIQRRRVAILAASGRVAESVEAAEEAVLLAQRVGEPYEIALAKRAAAIAAQANGEASEATDLLRTSQRLLEELGEMPERAITLVALARVLRSVDIDSEAIGCLHEARNFFTQVGFHDWVRRCDELLGLSPNLVSTFSNANRATPTSPDLSRFGIITEDARVLQAFSALKQIAPSTLPVLIEGESGTGKELFARALHILSPRANEPFLPLNCGAISPDMQEAELFGHARGSFTGAVTERAGYFESANHGTLFLDEIGEMSLAMQTKLLRVLETGELCRVGDTRVRRIDVRHVAATNQDLNACVERRDFRLDLLQRLNGLRLSIPPLRERRGDIARLLEHFMGLYAMDQSTPTRITSGLISKLVAYDWPGNVRELRLAVERAMILSSDSAWLAEDHFPFLNRESVSNAAGTLTGDLAEIERVRLLAALEKVRWSKSAAAKLLGLSRTTFNSKMQRLGIPFEAPDRFRSPSR